MVNRKQLRMNAMDTSVISNLIKHWYFYFISPVLCFWEYLCLGEAVRDDGPAGVSRPERLRLGESLRDDGPAGVSRPETLRLGKAVRDDGPAGVSRLETLKSEINHNFITVQTRCHAIAGRTARCRCKFQYVSNFTTAQHAFLVGLCLQTAVNYLSKSDK